MSRKLTHAGYDQGDMSPHVENYQKPERNYPEEGFSKTLDYIERHNSYVDREASEIRGQHYKGRYS